jgi:putative alpha-1,2-mannosidase
MLTNERFDSGWQNLWNHSTTSLNFTGFLAPKYANGTAIKDYDPTSCGACEWNSLTYEALPWEYSWTVPFDMETLIKFMGGPNATEARLDEMFKPGFQASRGSDGTNGIGSTIFNPGNEPSFATPFLYNYLKGRQHKSVINARETINTFYTNGPSGTSRS